jgi:hypothetical protein
MAVAYGIRIDRWEKMTQIENASDLHRIFSLTPLRKRSDAMG